MKKLISICIPTYEMHGMGAAFLKQSFDMLKIQTFKDFDMSSPTIQRPTT